MASSVELRSNILSTFKLSGLNLRVDATKYLMEILSDFESENERTNWLNKIVNCVMKQSLNSSLLERETIENVVKECTQQPDETDNFFHVIQSFDVPKFEFLTERKKFVERSCLNMPSLNVFGSADDKNNLYKERYEMIKQRVMHHDMFAPACLVGTNRNKKFDLWSVESLLASSGDVENCLCLGMLTQLKDDKFFLEDPTGFIEINLNDSPKFQTGLFTENSVVLVEGSYSEGIMKATAVGLPPIEMAAKSRECYGKMNFFGGPLKVCGKSVQKLLHLEQQLNSALFVFVSDVWLDDAKVLDKLKQLFIGFADSPPFCFVLCGQFLSKFYGHNHTQALKDGFKCFVEMLQEFPILSARSHFVIVPSLQEPLLANILPKPPLPSSVLQSVLCKLPNCYLATNPCRLQYCTQEIIIFREDIVEKMCRNCIRMPSDGAKISQHFVRTLLSQAHLVPLPLHVSPVHWAFDYTLRLYPLPDLIVCADKYPSYIENSNDCIVTNPGSFAKNKYSFQLYYPSTKQIEDSNILDD